MTSFFNQNIWNFCTRTFHKIVFAHTKFGVVQMEGSGVKATFHSTIPMRGQRATIKIQRNNYHHGS